jgi:hypothetical protein
MCNICDETFFLSRKQRVQLSKELSIQDVVNNAINQLYDDRVIDDATKKQLLQTHYEPLKMAVEEGFGKKLVNIEYGTPNYEFLKNLQTNTAVFASFKNHSSIKEMVALLKDADGNLRSRDSFKHEALKIDADYRGSKLDAEYDTAVRQARMAANWQKYEKNKRLYPNLKYILTKAAKPDEKHLQFVGIIRPVDDPFWNTHYPPNRWRCQCSVEQSDDDETDIPNNLPPIPADFAFNSGKLAQIFDINNSDYIKAAKPNEQPALIKMGKTVAMNDMLKTVTYQPLYQSKNGNTVEAHPLAFNNNDFDQVQKIAKELANLKMGVKTTQILPVLSNKDLRKSIMPDAPELKNPDYRLDGVLFDLKMPSGEKPGTRTIKNLLSDALAQAGSAVFVISENYKVQRYQLYKMIGNQFKQERYAAFELYLNFKGEWMNFNQKSWEAFYKSKFKK